MLLHYTDASSGQPVLVFLHYFGGSAQTWQPVINRLSSSCRCVAIDLAGFGHSTAPTHTPTVEENRDDVLQTLESLQLSSYVLVGHSFGGKIALAIAALQPAGLQSLVLLAPSPPTPEPMSPEDRQLLMNAFASQDKIEKHINEITAQPLPNDLFRQTVTDNLRAHENAWLGWLHKGSLQDISAEMMNVQVPLTVVSGAEDKGITTSFLQSEFRKYFQQVSFQEVQQSGHLLPLEQSDKVAEIIENAISRM
jgi:pimeloyl-ACP methyl ester carboxylesterase